MNIINQKFGIGDIIFSMTAIRAMKEKTLWPVLPEYVNGCNRAYPDIQFIDYNLLNIDWTRKDIVYTAGEVAIIPLAHQDVPLIDCMKNKYRFLKNQDWRQWKTKAMWKRDYNKEFELLHYLKIQEGEKFSLVNVNWGCWSPQGMKPGTVQAQFYAHGISDNTRTIKLDIINGFSLFDWATVIERAEVICTVSTSLLYLLELLNTSAKEIHLYPRLPREVDFRNVDYLFTKPYILHT